MKRFDINKEGVDYVVGDVHGCYDLLMQKLIEIGFDKKKDRLFSVGDLIDRGPKSLECLNLVYEPWFHAVRGNHEQMAIDCLSAPGLMPHWYENGGTWAAEHYRHSLKKIISDAVSKMPLAVEVETSRGIVGIVHAEPLDPWRAPESDADESHVLWERDRITNGKNTKISGIDAVVCGHTPQKQGVKLLGNVWYIDTGACFGSHFFNGHLTIMRLENTL